MHVLHVLTDKARRTHTHTHTHIKDRKRELIFFVVGLLGMGLEWAAVGVGTVWPEDGEGRRNLRKINIIGISLYKDANGILS